MESVLWVSLLLWCSIYTSIKSGVTSVLGAGTRFPLIIQKYKLLFGL